MPTSLSYFSNKYRCHKQFAQRKSSCVLQTCGQSIYICHVIVLNTLSVLANVWRHFQQIYFTLATLVSFDWIPSFILAISYTWLLHMKTMHLHSRQSTLIQIKQNQSQQYCETKGWERSKVLPTLKSMRVEGCSLQKNPQQMSFIVSWYKMIPTTTKVSLPKSKEREPRCIFFSPATLVNVNTSTGRKLSSKPDTTAEGCHSL